MGVLQADLLQKLAIDVEFTACRKYSAVKCCMRQTVLWSAEQPESCLHQLGVQHSSISDHSGISLAGQRDAEDVQRQPTYQPMTLRCHRHNMSMTGSMPSQLMRQACRTPRSSMHDTPFWN